MSCRAVRRSARIGSEQHRRRSTTRKYMSLIYKSLVQLPGTDNMICWSAARLRRLLLLEHTLIISSDLLFRGGAAGQLHFNDSAPPCLLMRFRSVWNGFTAVACSLIQYLWLQKKKKKHGRRGSMPFHYIEMKSNMHQSLLMLCKDVKSQVVCK